MTAKHIIFAIFAHPDDESFGPAGTLISEVENGSELHLISLTLGEAGTNPDNVANLATLRESEWRKAGQILKAASMDYLGFHDSALNNRDMIVAAEMIENLILGYIAKHPEKDLHIDLMTSDLNGITGHIDHIVAARATSLAFYRLKARDSRFDNIMYSCVPATSLETINTDWLFMEPGRNSDEVNKIVDARRYQEQIIGAIRAHKSQRNDGDNHLLTRKDDLGIDYFIVKQ